MKKSLIFILIVLFCTNAFAVFAGETVHVSDFKDCDYLTINPDTNCFVFQGCDKVDVFGFEWKCNCDSTDSFSLTAFVLADAPPSLINISMLKEIEIISYGHPNSRRVVREPVIIVKEEDLNEIIVVEEDLNKVIIVDDWNGLKVGETVTFPKPTVSIKPKPSVVLNDVNILPAPLVVGEADTSVGLILSYLILVVCVLVAIYLFFKRRKTEKQEADLK